MAITPTGAIYKTLNFDGVSSKLYGVYITGKAVFNSPERDVEMITIPGRNGAFALDNGRFENIEVTYPAGIFADTETDFAEAISDFRNILYSRCGYVRLEDDYNPDEYRLAIYKSGLEVSPAQLKAGEFEITFDCKPQRFLKSGETAVTISSSGTVLRNQTAFESHPLIEVSGYGDINIGDNTVTVENVSLGEIQISKSTTNRTLWMQVGNLNTGDWIYKKDSGLPAITLTITSVADDSVGVTIGSTSNCTAYIVAQTYRSKRLVIVPKLSTFLKGTSATVSSQVVLGIQINGSHYTATVEPTVTYDGIRDIALNATLQSFPNTVTTSLSYEHPAYYGKSTKTILPSTMYIDLDTGIAYGTVNSEVMSFNNAVTIPAQLPTLKPGNNTISYDNTHITSLKVVPRWWKI